MKLLCIDGNSVLNRAFYAIKLLTTKDGRYTNAIYGFMNIFIKLIDNVKPDSVCVAFDLSGPTFRNNIYSGYKANRKGMPDELAQQMQPLKDLLAALGYNIATCEGYEADDILGTFAKVCRENGDECFIATGDRDSLQLVSETVKVVLTTTRFGRGETEVVDTYSVFERYGVAPPQLIDVKALMGDASDNIPGVAGVGEKTALSLIQSFKSLDGVYENIDSPEIKPGVKLKLENGREIAYLSRELAEINCTTPIDTDLAHYVKTAGQPDVAAFLLGELEMHSLINRLSLGSAKAAATSSKTQAGISSSPTAIRECEIGRWQGGSAADSDVIYLLPDKDGYFAATKNGAYRLDKDSLKAVLTGGTPVSCWDAKRLCHAACDIGFSATAITFDLKLAAYLLSPSSASYAPLDLAREYHVSPAFKCENEELSLLGPLCEALRAKLVEQGMLSLHDDIELSLSGVLCAMERDGFLLDKSGVREFGGELEKLIDSEQEAVFLLCGRHFNLNSPKQLAEVLFTDLSLPPGKKTKSGFSTNAETLEGLRGVHPIIDHILNYRVYQKLRSTYVEGLLAAADSEGIIHSEFVQTETRTGRISSREPNLQNIPIRTELGSRFRKYFIAREGHVLLDADYSQIELRVLASVSDDTRMIDAFIGGHDIHTETAADIFRVPREMVTPELRRRAKAVNFGIVYGIGAFSLAKDTGVSFSEAKEYIAGYLAAFKDVAAYLEKTVENAKRDGYVTTMFGRRRSIPELASSNKAVQALGKRLAMNTPIQGSAADIIKIAMIKVAERLRRENLDARLILQVHDELIVESSLSDADAAAKVLREEMENACYLKAGLVTDVGTGESWFDAK